MSLMIPAATIAVLRKQNNVSVDLWGIACDLYIISNSDEYSDDGSFEIETDDIYGNDGEYEYTHYTTKVWIDWSPNMYRLRALGLYSEGELPILARFSTQAIDDAGDTVDVDILEKSYIKIDMNYVPASAGNYDEFEINAIMTGYKHDATVAKQFKLAPRRV